MKPDIDVPEGLVLVKKGGRPKNSLRDIAVFLAHPIKKAEFGKGYLADEWIVENFKLTDASHIRKCRKNARTLATERFISYGPIGPGKCMWLWPVAKRESEPVIPAGTIGWVWAEGMPEAVDFRMNTDTPVRVLVNQPGMKRQHKRENW